MLKIYTSIEKAKELSKLPIVYDVKKRFDLKFNANKKLFCNDISTKILQEIEGMTMRYDENTIKAKFGTVGMHDISTGGKGLLLAANYGNEIIVNIDPLGYNCVYMLFDIAKQTDIEVISTRTLLHMKPEFKAVVNGKECTGRKISFEMERYEDE